MSPRARERMRLIELNHSESSVRLRDDLFDVTVGITPPSDHWITGLGEPPQPYSLPMQLPLVLNGIEGDVQAVFDHDVEALQSAKAMVRVQLRRPMPAVMFVPDPALVWPGGITFETAMQLASVDDSVIVNWISEDREAWYFNFYSFDLGARRVSKREGSVSNVAHSMPIPCGP